MAGQVEQLITEHLDLWTRAQTAKSTSGRGSNNKIELTGIKKLRELILELAVRGKLVPQDPNDEPASELLERIAAEKEALVKAGKLKKQKPLPPITDDEKPFELPIGWEWARLGQLGLGSTGKTPSTSRPDLFVGGIPFIGPGQISADGVLQEAEKFLSEDAVSHSTEGLPNDILTVCIGGSIGKSTLLKSRVCFNQQINSLRPLITNPNFILYAVRSLSFMNALINQASGSATPIINRSKWEELLLPLPCHETQHKIVEKIAQLMTLCDQLEQQSYQQLDAHNQLVDALLATLTQSQNVDELASNWQRLVAYFNTLFTTEYSINALKQTILQLAEMGKLVKQDPNDEPASELLKRIAAEKDALTKAKVYQKIGKLLTKKKVSLPSGWSSVQMGEICLSIVPSRDKPKSFSGEMPWVTLPDFPLNSLYLDHKFVLNKMNSKEVVDSGARIIPPYSILMSCVGRFGLTAINQVEVTCNQQVHAFVVLAGTNPEYLSLVLKASTKELIESSSKTTVAYLNKSKCESIQLGLPPINEQSRIVAKIAELFSTCDRLSTKLLERKQTLSVLVEALVDQVVA